MQWLSHNQLDESPLEIFSEDNTGRLNIFYEESDGLESGKQLAWGKPYLVAGTIPMME